MAQLIAATQDAVVMTDFTVTNKSRISCYGMDGSEVVGTVYQKNSDSSYTALKAIFDPAKTEVNVVLSGLKLNIPIVSPGEYGFLKLKTEGTVGVDVTAAT